MKKIIYLILCSSFVLLQSCVKDQKDLFSEPANTRMTNAIAKYSSIIVDSPNGWIMEYYPKTTNAGGFQYLVSFGKDGTCNISADNDISGDTNIKVSSLYCFRADQGPVLSFDTKNSLLHLFSDPQSDGKGFEGDYEFIIMEATPDLVTLKGRKSGSTILLKKNTVAPIWKDYLDKIAAISTAIDSKYYKFTLEGKEITMKANSPRIFSFVYTDDSKVTNTYNIPFIVTTNGIQFYENLVINGKTMRNFVWEATANALKCTDAGINAKIETALTPINEFFATSTSLWIVDATKMSADFQTAYATMVKTSANEGENLTLAAFTFSQKYNSLSLAFKSGSYVGNIGFSVALDPINNNVLSLKLPKGLDGNGTYYFNSGYKTFATFICSQSYILTADDQIKPTKIKFTSAKDSNSWFELTLAN